MSRFYDLRRKLTPDFRLERQNMNHLQEFQSDLNRETVSIRT